ncbi:leucine carboxyl methyltransferase [Xylariaceae sp. FL1272]|nr:leucine carboxyl methyltransferase [Xylariaceae sp. FL1272]
MDTVEPTSSSRPKSKKRAKGERSAKEKAQDGLVMSTNSSSIVSKRSVERIYYPNEQHYFRYFVPKFQRRAPLINRGYHLRLHVIDTAVRRFLRRPSTKTKVVVNLGCGSDVLPWQCMTRCPDACRGVKFIDIDFPDLMEKKRVVVLNTPELSSVFEPLDPNAGGSLILKSDAYCQVGCDLRKTADIDRALASILDISECSFMFVAEVSITYMETPGADGVIQWARSLGHSAEFCLLEQILPEGPDHPFAQKMLNHFDKLKTPPKSVVQYPLLKSQHQRFIRLGWSQVRAQSLWDVWADDDWIPASYRRELDHIEPFDEWEEFALFASHYCVVIARSDDADHEFRGTAEAAFKDSPPLIDSLDFSFLPCSGAQGKRRFGAPLNLRDEHGEQVVANTYGLGTNNRLRSCDLYGPERSDIEINMHSSGPSGRLCHAVVDLGFSGSLLVGGRTSPTTVLRDCWHFSIEQNRWAPTHDLPVPLYRHAMTRLGRTNMVLLLGGKTDSSTVFKECLLYKLGSGWAKCSMSGSKYRPVFGAVLFSVEEKFPDVISDGSAQVMFKGLVAGGISENGLITDQLLRWNLTLLADGTSSITFDDYQLLGPAHINPFIHRFGASTIPMQNGCVAIIGGVARDGVVPRGSDIFILNASDSNIEFAASYGVDIVSDRMKQARPLLVGTSISLTSTGQLLFMGGGATCFSMGTFWNEGSYLSASNLRSLLSPPTNRSATASFAFQKLVETVDMPPARLFAHGQDARPSKPEVLQVPRVRVPTTEAFEAILTTGKPVIMHGCTLGECVDTWTAEGLKAKVGAGKKVVVHEASGSTMDFNAKNFKYVTKDFATFVTEIEGGGKQYLRALSEERPSELPANLATDFAGLASDFILPPELSVVQENLFSSVLRISGNVNMWLHYDVMANVYCQITGSKRLLLFPPEDVNYLSFPPGTTTSSIDVFSEIETSALSMTHPHEAILEPGDVLFLPPVWLHATAPLSDFGVAVNVFFRSLDAGYAAGRDVYGNRDMAAYEKGRQDVTRIAKSFSRTPRDMQVFYLRRLADELAQHATG